MPDYRCPKHDRIITSTSDHRPPGSPARDGFAAMPINGHPDCDKCREDLKAAPAKTSTGGTTLRRIS